VIIAVWALTPMARAMLLLRDAQHSMGGDPVIAGIQSTEAHFYTTSDLGSGYSVTTDNPIPIAGWLVLDHPNAPTVIVLPAWKEDRTTMLKYATFMVQGGLNVLLIDLRGSGRSGGQFSLGLYEPTDVKGAISYLDTLPTLNNHHYGVFGVSFGAGIALSAAGGNGDQYAGDTEIDAIVADSPWASESDTVDRLNALDIGGLSIPLPHTATIAGHTIDFLPGAAWAVDHTVGGDPDTRSALLGAKHLQAGQSLLIIHAAQDNNPTTTLAAAQQLYNAAPVTHKFLWLAPLGGHAGAYDAQPQVYTQKVMSFFKTYLVNLKNTSATSSYGNVTPAPYHG
jgi:pimeloyl-ACP methyl ester carboxylesterase